MGQENNCEIIEEFCRHFCIVCHKRIIVPCGTPVVHIGGCCAGVDDEGSKTFYVRTLKAHFGCYIEHKIPSNQKRLKDCSVKLRWKFDDVKKIVEDEKQCRQ